MAGRFTLYDPSGREVDLDALKQPPPARAPIKASKAFELDPETVVGLFKAADGGDPRQLQAMAGEIERRDGHMGGQIRTRRRAVSRLNFAAETPADTSADGGLADEVVTSVRRDVLDAMWFRGLVRDLLDANLRGFSVAEITWETTPTLWRPRAVTWVDQRATVIDQTDGLTVRWRDPADEAKAVDIAPYTAVIHGAGDVSGPLWSRGLMRVLAILYSIKRLGVRAWAAFVELYGVPRLLATTPQSWTEKQAADFLYQLEIWGQAGILVAPQGAAVTGLQAGAQTGDAHGPLATWCDDQASLAIIGQTMTARDGASRAQAEVHQEVADWILESDAWDVAGTLTRDLVTPYVRLNFGEDAPVPVITPQILGAAVRAAREFRLKVLEVLLPHGLRVEQSVARDLAGIPEPAADAEVLTPGAPRLTATTPPTRAARRSLERTRTKAMAEDGQDFVDRDGDAAAGAWRETMQPLVDTVEAAGRDAQGDSEAAKFADFLRRVEEGAADGDKLVKSIATWTMQARGVGDGTDEVD